MKPRRYATSSCTGDLDLTTKGGSVSTGVVSLPPNLISRMRMNAWRKRLKKRVRRTRNSL